MSIVQSILFDSKMWDVREAVRWLQENGFKATKIDQSNFFYFIQVSPVKLEKKGYTELKKKRLNNGIEFVLAYKPNLAHDEDCI